jgi:hypothetical protein
MQSMVFKLGAGALAVAALAAIVGAYMPTAISQMPQKERIESAARVAGASNVRIRAAEAEARRGPTPPSSGYQTPVVLGATDEARTDDSQQVQPSGYSGTVPVPQTVFEGESQQGAETASDTATQPSAEE